MGDALRDKSRKQQLLSLRGRVLGRSRAVLGADPGDRSQPPKISKGLYLESKYDTETLLYVLTERVALSPIGYNPHHAALVSCCNLHSFLATASPLPAAGAAVIYTIFSKRSCAIYFGIDWIYPYFRDNIHSQQNEWRHTVMWKKGSIKVNGETFRY